MFAFTYKLILIRLTNWVYKSAYLNFSCRIPYLNWLIITIIDQISNDDTCLLLPGDVPRRTGGLGHPRCTMLVVDGDVFDDQEGRIERDVGAQGVG